jgi:chemotaxis signal transduction protein
MLVEFMVEGHHFVATLDEVREIVRDARIQRLPGCRPPVVGVVDVRGVTVPVADARPVVDVGSGDIVILVGPGVPVLGVVVDRVLAVTDDSAWGERLPAPDGMPEYVLGLLPRGDEVTPVVDLRTMVELSAAARALVGSALS